MEDYGGESGVGAEEVLGAVVAQEGVAEEGEGAVVVEAVGVGCLVDEGAGEGFYGEVWAQAETGV